MRDACFAEDVPEAFALQSLRPARFAAAEQFWIAERLQVEHQGLPGVPLGIVAFVYRVERIFDERIVAAASRSVIEELPHHELVTTEVVETSDDQQEEASEGAEETSNLRQEVQDAVDTAEVSRLRQRHLVRDRVLKAVFVVKITIGLEIRHESCLVLLVRVSEAEVGVMELQVAAVHHFNVVLSRFRVKRIPLRLSIPQDSGVPEAVLNKFSLVL